jgi:hypothetical protein
VASTVVNPDVLARCRTALTEQGERFDALAKQSPPAIAEDLFGPGDDAAALARTARAFDQALSGQLSRTAGLLHSAASSVGGSSEMFQAVEEFNTGAVKPI